MSQLGLKWLVFHAKWPDRPPRKTVKPSSDDQFGTENSFAGSMNRDK